jgi:hypothetical protein
MQHGWVEEAESTLQMFKSRRKDEAIVAGSK